MMVPFTAPVRAVWAYFLEFTTHAKSLLVASLIVSFFASALEGVGLFLLVPILSLLNAGSRGESPIANFLDQTMQWFGLSARLEVVLVLFLSLMILRSFVNSCQSALAARITNGFMNNLRMGTYRAISEAGWLHLAMRMSSQYSQALTTQADHAAAGGMLFLRLMNSFFSIIAGMVVAFVVSPYLTLAAGVSALLIFIPMTLFDYRAYRIGQSSWAAMQAIFEQLSRHLGGLKAARILSVEDRYRREFSDLSQRYSNLGIALADNSATAALIHSAASSALLCGLVYLAVRSGIASVEPILLAVIFARLLPRFQMAQGDLRELLATVPQYNELQQIVTDARTASEQSISPRADIRMRRELRLDDICFRYHAHSQMILTGLSLTIHSKSSLGIVGTSGAGKTTIADIVAGLFLPTSGRVLIDDHELAGTDLRAWRRRVSYVAQEEFLFNDTVRTNLTIARPETSDAEIREALALAHAGKFVEELPGGLDETIGDRGARLSRGQRQRLCLARALIGNPDVLILDEATSALNPVDEKDILEALKEIAGRVAVLVIAHRISSIAWTDRIIVLGDGRILEEGSFASLRRRRFSFARAMMSADSSPGKKPGTTRKRKQT